jgi:hypothetical protein
MFESCLLGDLNWEQDKDKVRKELEDLETKKAENTEQKLLTGLFPRKTTM